MSIKKTNAARMLDTLGIAYTLRAFDVDLEDLSATHAAATLGEDPERVFKTLVARGDKHGIVMACIPAVATLDLKGLAQVTKNKTIELVALKEVLPLTGYMRGGCSPLAGKKNYPVVIDESVILHEYVTISAGQRGLQIVLSPHDLVKATNGLLACITVDF